MNNPLLKSAAVLMMKRTPRFEHSR